MCLSAASGVELSFDIDYRSDMYTCGLWDRCSIMKDLTRFLHENLLYLS